MQEDTLTLNSTPQRFILVIWKAYLEMVSKEPFLDMDPYVKSRWWKEKSMYKKQFDSIMQTNLDLVSSYAFVTYDDKASALDAIQSMHGALLGSRNIKGELCHCKPET